MKCSFYRFDRRFVTDENILSARKVDVTIIVQVAEGITIAFFCFLKIVLIINQNKLENVYSREIRQQGNVRNSCLAFL